MLIFIKPLRIFILGFLFVMPGWLAAPVARGQAGVRLRSLGGYGADRTPRRAAVGTLLPADQGFIAERSLEPVPTGPKLQPLRRIEPPPIGGRGGPPIPIGGASVPTGRGFATFGARGGSGLGLLPQSLARPRRNPIQPRSLGSPFPRPLVLERGLRGGR